MNRSLLIITGILLASASMPASHAQQDNRQLVELPAMMQEHMLANMRDHLATIDAVLAALAQGQAERAAELAEQHLGMSSLGRHGAVHMASADAAADAGDRNEHAPGSKSLCAQGTGGRFVRCLRSATGGNSRMCGMS